MAAASGSLVVSLGLNAVDYVQGLTRAEYQTKQAVGNISKQISGIGSAFKSAAAAVGVGFGVHQITEWASGILDAAKNLDELSQETGSTIEQLSKLENVIKVSGSSLEQFRPILERYTAALGQGEDGTTRVTEALHLLGVSSTDPVEALTQAGRVLNTYAASAQKAALVKELFPGRGGLQFLDTLKLIGDNQDIVATKTAEQVRQAVELKEAFAKLEIQSHAMADVFLNEIVPALLSMVTRFLEARKASDDLFGALKIWAQFNPFADATQNLEYFDSEISKLEEKIKNPTFLGFRVGVSDQLKNDLEQLKKARQIAIDEAARTRGGFPTNAPQKALGQAPKLPPKGQAEAILKRQLQQDLKEQENAIQAEQDVLRDREHFLESYYRDDLIGLEDYYSGRLNAIDEARTKTVAALDKELAALEEYKRKAKPPEAIAAQTQIEDVLAKRNKAEREAATQRFDVGAQRARDIQQYTDAVSELNAKLGDLAGFERDAAEIRFDIQTRQIRAQAAGIGDTATLQRLAALRQQAGAQADLNVETQKYAILQGDLAIAQARINLSVEAGIQTSLDGINARSDLARQAAAALTEQADAQERVARSLAPGPAQEQALAAVARLRLEIDQLKESANELEHTFRSIFVEGVTQGLTDIIGRTKSVSDAFKDMGKSIARQIDQIAAKNISETLFGKTGALGGIPEFFAKVFGGGGGATAAIVGGAGADTALATSATATATALTAMDASTVVFSTTATAASASLTTLIASATAAAAALTAVAASGAGGAAGDIFSSLFSGTGSAGMFGGFVPSAYAAGGSVRAGRSILVGERGPELFSPYASGQITPNDQLGMGGQKIYNIPVTINVPEGTTRQSAAQIGLRTATELNRTLVRDG